jgi:DNA polymerase-1
MLLQVHDELVCEVKEKLVTQIAQELKKIMESVYRLDIPLIVDVKYGNNWQEMLNLSANKPDGAVSR